MRVGVIGATGFIGGAIARAALAKGHSVRGVRRAESVGALEGVDLEWVHGDLGESAGLVEALRGCEVVFHAAGHYPTVSLDRGAVLRRGVTEMRNLLQAAREAGARRVVYTSSLSTIGPAEAGRLADERDQYLPGSVPDPYWEVKWLMEQECWRAHAEGLETVVLNPTMCFGPGDVKPTSGTAILHVAKKRLPAYSDGAWNVVDVRDVAAAHVEAATRGKSGERYVLGDHNVTVSIFFNHVATAAGVAPPRLQVPDAVVRSAAWASEVLSLVTGRPPLLPIEGVDMIRFGQHFDSSKARRELDLGSRPIETIVQDALEWFRAQGRLRE